MRMRAQIPVLGQDTHPIVRWQPQNGTVREKKPIDDGDADPQGMA
jgi:hypothetical protein